MSKTFDQGREEIARLCRYFADNRQAFLAPGVKEAHVRLSLIDPLFEALGWDLRNAAMIAPQYREVITEDSLEIEGQQKAPDYAFRVGTLSKFYTEAKKCGININADPGPAYQLRRYGWSAKVPLSILTDFEEFGVYDCSLRPKPVDKASFGRIQYYKSEEYPDRWRELWDIFSREAVWAGAYDRYAASKRKRGTSEVDSEFLKEIEGWRDSLAHNIALRNQFLSSDDLNAAVQRTIDRIIFLRMAEDRGSESYGQLLKLCDQPEIYSRFMSKSCKNADEKYNSGLFHFRKEEGITESLDVLTPKLHIDDKVFKPILQSLYFEHGSPYHFGVLPVEILGTVYERFLGKVIRLTPEHRAKVEEKPEVRKAGGVYYTPSYIVDYIVKNTVGKMIEGRSPAQLGGKSSQPLRVLDMACGSGSFLLGAFQCLLDHCLKWYMEHQPEKFKNEIFKNRRDEWQLTIAEKKRILTSHIFGVDIDAQAVEVSKLSLLLKVMEGETDETVGKSRQLFHERALPNLANNIKCGNSLIGPDYFSGRLIPDPDEMKRVNPFDWNREFPEAIKSGGFDCVIGNPPYVDIKSLPSQDVSFIFSSFKTANNRINLFVTFIEKSLLLVKTTNFRFSMIIPTAFLTQESYKEMRKLILERFQIINLVRLPNESFGSSAGEVKVDTVIVTLGNAFRELGSTEIVSYMGYERISSIDSSKAKNHEYIDQNIWKAAEDKIWTITTGVCEEKIISKCINNSVPLDETVEISLGLTPYDKYKGHTQDQIKNQVFHATSKKDSTFRKLLAGNDVRRYEIEWNGERWISYGPWLGAPREKKYFIQNRILVKQIIDWTEKRIWASITSDELYNTQNAFNLILKPGWNIHFILGVLNSRLMTFYHRKKFLDEYKMRFQKILIKDCRQFPIIKINISNKVEKAFHDQIVCFVESMLNLYKIKSKAINKNERDIIQRQIFATDCQIDQIVYKLYGLTEEEINIVEDATAKGGSCKLKS